MTYVMCSALVAQCAARVEEMYGELDFFDFLEPLKLQESVEKRLVGGSRWRMGSYLVSRWCAGAF